VIPYEKLPAVNAALNGLCAALLLVGFGFIRRRRIVAHRRTMKTAFVVSVLFLVSYLTYHSHAGVHRYPGTGFARSLYLTILATHTVLAAAVVPLVLRTLHLANRSRFVEHRRIARWTLPIWFYVSVTGVVVYAMLYRPFGPRGDASNEYGRPASRLTRASPRLPGRSEENRSDTPQEGR
jgi:putative membrane protein